MYILIKLNGFLCKLCVFIFLLLEKCKKINYNLYGYIFLYLFLEWFCFLIVFLYGFNNLFGIFYKRGIKLYVKYFYMNDIFW